jgi:hypothetical protein
MKDKTTSSVPIPSLPSLSSLPSLPPLPSSRKRSIEKNSSIHSNDANQSATGMSIPSLPVFKSKLTSSTLTSSALSSSSSRNESYININVNISNDNGNDNDNKENKANTNLNSPMTSTTSATSKGTYHPNSNSNNSHCRVSSSLSSKTTQSVNKSISSGSSLPSSSSSSSLLSSRRNILQQRSQKQIWSSPSPPNDNNADISMTSISSSSAMPAPNTIQRRQTRVLRSGDTIESFFCLFPPSSPLNIEKYNRIKTICNDIVNDINGSSTPPPPRKEVLLYTYNDVENCIENNNKKMSMGKFHNLKFGQNYVFIVLLQNE